MYYSDCKEGGWADEGLGGAAGEGRRVTFNKELLERKMLCE